MTQDTTKPDTASEKLLAEYRNRMKCETSGGTQAGAASAYSIALDIRKFEIELYWKRAAYFWAFAGAALAAHLAALTGKELENRAEALMVTSCIGLLFAVGYRVNGRIQHRVHQFGIWARADRPTDDLTIEAIDHG